MFPITSSYYFREFIWVWMFMISPERFYHSLFNFKCMKIKNVNAARNPNRIIIIMTWKKPARCYRHMPIPSYRLSEHTKFIATLPKWSKKIDYLIKIILCSTETGWRINCSSIFITKAAESLVELQEEWFSLYNPKNERSGYWLNRENYLMCHTLRTLRKIKICRFSGLVLLFRIKNGKNRDQQLTSRNGWCERIRTCENTAMSSLVSLFLILSIWFTTFREN